MKIIYTILLFTGFLLLIGCATTRETKAERPPNIILIMADDLGMETVGSYGGEDYATPRLDQLAAGGMQFQHCYANPLCTPSRIKIMTGKYNFRNYIGFGLLDPKEQTFGNILRDAGYTTCIVGKWQLYGNARQRELAGRGGTLPTDAGFDNYKLWQVKDRGFRYKTPTLETSGTGLETYEEAYGPDKFVDYLDDFITQNRDTNFFVYYPMCLVHDPFLPSPDSPDYTAYDPETRTNDTTYFRDMMAYMDHEVGRIVDRVEELGLTENTLIIFTGDNGTDRKVVSRWNGQRVPGRKGYTEEWGTHVPLIAHWPGRIAAGQKNDNLIEFTDFLPTLLDAAGVPMPADHPRDGLSFYPQLLGEDAPVREYTYCSYDPRWGNFTARTYVQNKAWKLYEDGTFYHFAEDPREENPIPDERLTAEEKAIKVQFEKVLAEMREGR
ncbi:sulfatase-like hydrolase/transferase [Flavilitoribacter nigricans]|uniref:Arylsulfatase n=1 Tax=Flavilitoribacter nigricans (strain ATCC 23147 / DSM 23189 / NBRC 102662 / NCIMB 1420 / SS-2) TaxID=1122177 RepID=A0A2D0MYN4_FLAN2|nr:sulfatase-like hydrolase/transferase [Flavilitoribacter nigricans]PHN01337.1 arylsulfatase [Flavilitoribacter nigricans DSM 23189 = NBRC 102662]